MSSSHRRGSGVSRQSTFAGRKSKKGARGDNSKDRSDAVAKDAFQLMRLASVRTHKLATPAGRAASLPLGSSVSGGANDSFLGGAAAVDVQLDVLEHKREHQEDEDQDHQEQDELKRFLENVKEDQTLAEIRLTFVPAALVSLLERQAKEKGVTFAAAALATSATATATATAPEPSHSRSSSSGSHDGIDAVAKPASPPNNEEEAEDLQRTATLVGSSVDVQEAWQEFNRAESELRAHWTLLRSLIQNGLQYDLTLGQVCDLYWRAARVIKSDMSAMAAAEEDVDANNACGACPCGPETQKDTRENCVLFLWFFRVILALTIIMAPFIISIVALVRSDAVRTSSVTINGTKSKYSQWHGQFLYESVSDDRQYLSQLNVTRLGNFRFAGEITFENANDIISSDAGFRLLLGMTLTFVAAAGNTVAMYSVHQSSDSIGALSTIMSLAVPFLFLLNFLAYPRVLIGETGDFVYPLIGSEDVSTVFTVLLYCVPLGCFILTMLLWAPSCSRKPRTSGPTDVLEDNDWQECFCTFEGEEEQLCNAPEVSRGFCCSMCRDFTGFFMAILRSFWFMCVVVITPCFCALPLATFPEFYTVESIFSSRSTDNKLAYTMTIAGIAIQLFFLFFTDEILQSIEWYDTDEENVVEFTRVVRTSLPKYSWMRVNVLSNQDRFSAARSILLARATFDVSPEDFWLDEDDFGSSKILLDD